MLKNHLLIVLLFILAAGPFLFIFLKKAFAKKLPNLVLRKKKKDIQEIKNGEFILDLQFNNEKLGLSHLISFFPDMIPFSFLYSVLYFVVIMIIAEQLKFIFLTRSSFFVLANLSMINLWVYYRKSIYKLKEDYRHYQEFIHKDVVLMPETIAFAPYLFSPPIENSYLYEEFFWNDIVRVRVRKEGIYSVHLNDGTHFNLDRNCFFTQEKVFLRYLLNKKNIPVNLEDSLFGESDIFYLFGIHVLKLLPVITVITGIIYFAN